MHRERQYRSLTMLAKTPVVPRAVSGLHRVRVNVEILTVFIVTLSKLLKEIADGHLGHVVLVQELAVVPLLAQVSQPVLADDRLFSADVSEGTVGSLRTRATQEVLTDDGLVFCGKWLHGF